MPVLLRGNTRACTRRHVQTHTYTHTDVPQVAQTQTLLPVDTAWHKDEVSRVCNNITGTRISILVSTNNKRINRYVKISGCKSVNIILKLTMPCKQCQQTKYFNQQVFRVHGAVTPKVKKLYHQTDINFDKYETKRTGSGIDQTPASA